MRLFSLKIGRERATVVPVEDIARWLEQDCGALDNETSRIVAAELLEAIAEKQEV